MDSAPVVALLLLLFVLIVAAVGSRRIAVAASLASAFVLNYFFLLPVGTLHIASLDDVLVWVVFIAVSLVGSHLATTARRRTAEALAQRDELARLLEARQAGEAAKRRAELATTLLKSMGHDLRTPLTAIEIAAANLQVRDAPETLRREQAAIVREQVSRLTRTFDRIISMARIDAGVIEVDPEWVFPADIIDAAVQEVADDLRGHRVEQSADETAAFVDPRLTSSALARILENAARHSPPGGRIGIEARVMGPRLEITVDDEGAGIEAAALPHVFEPFFRGPANGRPGLGMGLTIARGLLTAQGGDIVGENRPHGARFRLTVASPSSAAAST